MQSLKNDIDNFVGQQELMFNSTRSIFAADRPLRNGSYSVKWTGHMIDGEEFFLTTIII